jgi:nicotinamide-nucleotide amidase
MMFSDELKQSAASLVVALREAGLQIAAVDSCTGGLLAAALTECPGSSTVFDRGFVTYSIDAKIEMIGVRAELIATHGAVSRDVALAMAEGGLIHSQADLAVSITGLAGPGGGTLFKPVGLVHIAAARIGCTTLHRECRFGPLDRETIRLRAVADALALASQALRHAPESRA